MRDKDLDFLETPLTLDWSNAQIGIFFDPKSAANKKSARKRDSQNGNRRRSKNR
jgi:hypothetical protein